MLWKFTHLFFLFQSHLLSVRVRWKEISQQHQIKNERISKIIFLSHNKNAIFSSLSLSLSLSLSHTHTHTFKCSHITFSQLSVQWAELPLFVIKRSQEIDLFLSASQNFRLKICLFPHKSFKSKISSYDRIF